ncbi:MAG TPA: HAD family phosphatase [Isosphaeraceae bacterium]
MSPAPIRAVAFDLDGLMFDTEALFARVLRGYLEERGRSMTPEIMAAMIGRRAAEAYPAFRRLTGFEDPPEELLAEVRCRFTAEVDTAVHPTPGLIALLAHLERRGIPRAVATSSRREYAERLIERHGLRTHFAFILGAEDVTHGKPNPEIYQRAAQRFEVEPSQLLVLEDSAPGLAAAKAAGAFAVGVPHEHSPAEGLSAADLIVPRLDDSILLGRIDER